MLERSHSLLSHDQFVYLPRSLMRARLFDAMRDRRRARSG
jgi:hypothetical protein